MEVLVNFRTRGGYRTYITNAICDAADRVQKIAGHPQLVHQHLFLLDNELCAESDVLDILCRKLVKREQHLDLLGCVYGLSAKEYGLMRTGILTLYARRVVPHDQRLGLLF